MSKRGFLNLIIIVYCIGGLIIYHFHEKWILKPNVDTAVYELPFEWKNINIPISQSTSMHLLQVKPADSAKGVVIYFGSQRGNVWSQKNQFESIPSKGYEVIAMDYPGYGTSIGKFTEDSVYFRALTTYQFARARYEPNQIILMGDELGTAVASYVATKKDAAALVLSNPIAHFKDFIFLKIYPLERMMKYKFPTSKYLQEVIAPVYYVGEESDMPQWISAQSKIQSIPDIKNILN